MQKGNKKRMREAMHGKIFMCCLTAGLVVGCTNPEDDPYGCFDRGTFRVDDRILPDAVVGVDYAQWMNADPGGFLTLVDTAKVAEYGLLFDGRKLTGIPTKVAAKETFRWVSSEFGTQCQGRSDTFTTELTISPAP